MSVSISETAPLRWYRRAWIWGAASGSRVFPSSVWKRLTNWRMRMRG